MKAQETPDDVRGNVNQAWNTNLRNARHALVQRCRLVDSSDSMAL